MSIELAMTLRALADRVRRNIPHHRDPERFHVEKDEIAKELAREAKKLSPRAGDKTLPQRGRKAVPVQETIVVNGRRVTVQRHRPSFAI